jgi:hypothetical protein
MLSPTLTTNADVTLAERESLPSPTPSNPRGQTEHADADADAHRADADNCREREGGTSLLVWLS